jgi:hypothetical protein
MADIKAQVRSFIQDNFIMGAKAAEFADAHRLAAGMVAFALLVLVTLYAIQRSARAAEARR